jgi:hypothetical protein
MLNLSTGFLLLAVFSGACAYGTGDSVERVARPLAYGALAMAAAYYLLSFI